MSTAAVAGIFAGHFEEPSGSLQDLLQLAFIEPNPPARGTLVNFDSVAIANFHFDIAGRTCHFAAYHYLILVRGLMNQLRHKGDPLLRDWPHARSGWNSGASL